MTKSEMRALVNMVADEVVRRLNGGTEDEWLTTAKAADVLGWSPHTVRVKAEQLPNNGKSGKARRYSKIGLIKILSNEEVY